ncbi:YwmB family TATA-box binding protein [Calidifontibacillus erzurumensis]|uniref:YwmB family TATA-box binding protein n=1 Tax=Calidifontibacillus erzurumensis TaxID=2741433 RepID=A0A8J8GDW3_9BACI|nr:YwmB family TATA-box binding protein [Calidifontibacillus erzurumensis]NSL52065.1 YwmB family TATA-box binding protein [Calidifontibacillus erzurumensis]
MIRQIFILLPLIIVLFFQQYSYGNSEGIGSSANSAEQLIEMIQVMQKHNIDVQKWSIYARDDQQTYSSMKQYKKSLQDLKEENSDFTWTHTKEKDIYKTIGVKTTSDKDGFMIQEQIIFVAYPHKNFLQSYLIYTAEGETGDLKLIRKNLPAFQEKIGTMFDKKTQIFTCVNGENGDIMEGVLYNKALEILEDFSAQSIEEIQEGAFVSISAYTEHWKNSIPTKNKEMNIQISLRKLRLGDTTTVTIGTPIITSEY